MSVTYCKVCKSPYRDEIEKFFKKGINPGTLARKYAYVHGNTPESLKITLASHFKRKHPIMLEPVPQRSLMEEEAQARKQKELEEQAKNPPPSPTVQPNSVEDYAQKLLAIGLDPKLLDPNKVKHRDIQGAQKLLLEKERVKNERDALKLSMFKLMSGMMDKGEVIPGEIVSSGVQRLVEGTKE